MFQDLKREVGQGAPSREWLNRLLDRLESLVVSPGPGLLMRRASNGTVLSAQSKRSFPGGEQYESVILPTRFFKGTGEESDTWKVEFTSTNLFEHSMHHAGKAHGIKLGGGVLTDDPKPSASLEVGEKEVWLKFDILESCEVDSATPEIIIGDAPDREAFWPRRPGLNEADEPGSYGKTGHYRQKLGTITLEEGEGKTPVWKSESPHAVVWIGQTEWEDASTDDGQSLYYKYEEGLDIFKTIKNADIEVEEGSEPVLNDEEAPHSPHIVLARICRRSSDPQIHVESEGENEARKIIIKGNNVNLSLSGLIRNLQTSDGLAVSAEEATAGWWGTIVLTFVDPGAPSQENQVRLTIEDGRIVLIEKEQSAGGFEEVAGTEATPGSVQFYAENVFA